VKRYYFIRNAGFPKIGTVAGNEVFTQLFSSGFRIISDTEGDLMMRNRAISHTENAN